MDEQLDNLAETITRAEGKILAESRLEVSRAGETLIGAAEEAKRLGSEVVRITPREGRLVTGSSRLRHRPRQGNLLTRGES